ncbi:Uma2 family endonuclease [cf. Phormidesmis sp. LEGE 11477]|nr:Uma2 family endonuclease [cf. Phormidesmis sp. LEGE 11477]
MMTLTLDMQAADLHIGEAEFYRLCQANQDLRLELSAKGNLIIMPPTGWDTGHRNSTLNHRLVSWAEKDKSGLVFDSSTGFILPNGAIRSPDVAWVLRSRLEAINPNPNKFLPLCPDFAVELRSANDRLLDSQAKLEEYIDNGLRLGWLINPKDNVVEIYRPQHATETLPLMSALSGDPVLPGFKVDLAKVFS